MRGSWTFSRKLALGFAAIVVAFAIVAITGLRTTQALAANTDLVVHTHEVRIQLGKLLATLIDAETSERGFAITGADRFLEPYQTTRETEAGASQTLQTSSQLTSLSTRLVQAT